jgi:hypothetical protein
MVSILFSVNVKVLHFGNNPVGFQIGFQNVDQVRSINSVHTLIYLKRQEDRPRSTLARRGACVGISATALLTLLSLERGEVAPAYTTTSSSMHHHQLRLTPPLPATCRREGDGQTTLRRKTAWKTEPGILFIIYSFGWRTSIHIAYRAGHPPPMSSWQLAACSAFGGST